MKENNSNTAEKLENEFSKEESGNQFLTFMIGGEYYGVEILQVQEIKAWTPVTKVPNTPASIKGVLNLRGEIVPIIDMRAIFGHESVQYSSLTVIIVLSLQDAVGKSRTLGIVADSVSDVVGISDEDIKPVPELREDINTDFVSNVATIDDKMVMLLDILLLLDTSNIEDAVEKSKNE